MLAHFGYFSSSRRRGEDLRGKPTLAIIRAGLLSLGCAHSANLSIARHLIRMQGRA